MPRVGELLLYGDISDFSWWGDEVTPKQFHEDLQALGDIDELHVFINSRGGDIFAGQAIHSMLKRHKAQVVVYVDGLAASAASVVAMAGNVIRMPRNAMMMIHNAWTIALGNAEEFRKVADTLDQIGKAIMAAYQEKTGMPEEEIAVLMNAETWMTAEEAVAMGFADEIEEAKQVAASLNGKLLVVNGQQHDLSRYRHPPKLEFLPSSLEAQRPPAAPDPPNNTPTGERQLPLSLYERRLRLRQLEGRVASR